MHSRCAASPILLGGIRGAGWEDGGDVVCGLYHVSSHLQYKLYLRGLQGQQPLRCKP